jgi:hypothetical protein
MTSTETSACGWCGRQSPDLQRCAGCKITFYCSRHCQAKAWKEGGHRDKCRVAVDPKNDAVAIRMTQAFKKLSNQVFSQCFDILKKRMPVKQKIVLQYIGDNENIDADALAKRMEQAVAYAHFCDRTVNSAIEDKQATPQEPQDLQIEVSPREASGRPAADAPGMLFYVRAWLGKRGVGLSEFELYLPPKSA